MELDADAAVTTIDTEGAVTAGGVSPTKTLGATLTMEVREEVGVLQGKKLSVQTQPMFQA